MKNTHIIHEQADKVWAIRTTEPFDGEITAENFRYILGGVTLGLAHKESLALARLEAATESPRSSADRLYEMSFVEAGYHLGSLAVIAFSPATRMQPKEWLVEGFIGDALEPEIHTLPMDYRNDFGVDVSDIQNLNLHTEEWYPAG